MRKRRNHSQLKEQENSQLKEQENSPEGANKETGLCSLTNTEFKKEVMKLLKELRMDINSNTGYFWRELETINKSQEKLGKKQTSLITPKKKKMPKKKKY